MELKTLKDLKQEHWEGQGDFFVEEKDLKQEAIKWVKHFRDLCLFGEAKGIGTFFNLTDEDLN
jgi:hypothetical protein